MDAGRDACNYDMAIPPMLPHYFPTGLLGLGLTALLASFMSGMAGNVTAFNTVWTYDIYQAYIKPDASDAHYLWMGHFATVFGIACRVAAAYLATRFNNIMDMLQLVFAFVNAPLFATFLLGMFWKRATGHGAFFGPARRHAGRGAPSWPDACRGRRAGHQGWLGRRAPHLSERDGAELLDGDLAWTVCFVATIVMQRDDHGPTKEHESASCIHLPADRRGAVVVHAAGRHLASSSWRYGPRVEHHFW